MRLRINSHDILTFIRMPRGVESARGAAKARLPCLAKVAALTGGFARAPNLTTQQLQRMVYSILQAGKIPSLYTDLPVLRLIGKVLVKNSVYKY